MPGSLLNNLRTRRRALKAWLDQTAYLNRSRAYWLKAAGAVLLGIYVGRWLSEDYVGMPWRYQVSQLQQLLMPQARARWTALLLIDDDEYWKGSLARRVPIHRDYLAALLRKVSSCDPWLIALDFNFRSPVVDGSLPDNPPYLCETIELVSAVREVSKHTPVVLPVTISGDHRFVEPSVLDAVQDKPREVVRGTISLPFDYRQTPTSELVRHRQAVNSFALAAAALVRPQLLDDYPPDRSFPFAANFISKTDFPTFYYREAPGFPNPEQCHALRHKVVIVGSAWHQASYRNGDLIDVRQDTPMGAAGAVFLHANYVEALLSDRTYSSLGPIPGFLVELLCAAFVAVTLAMPWGHLSKFLVAGATAILLFLLTYVFAQNVGLYADFFFAVMFLFLHALWNYWDDLREAKAREPQLMEQLTQARADLDNLRQSTAAPE